MGLLLRAARRVGEGLAFEPSGPLLWARARTAIEDLLLSFWREGALAGASAAQAFSVRCDRSTMTPADLDNGRLIVVVSVRPAAAIERITVVLNLGNPADAAGAVRVAA
jgi:phage tail sheath protein FI